MSFDLAPTVLLDRRDARSAAVFIDVNPHPSPGSPILLFDGTAILASIRNLLLSPEGSRGRIFQEDYFARLFDLLQEPLDDTTSNLISVSLFQSIIRWEPRIRMQPSDVQVFVDEGLPGYRILLAVTVNGVTSQANFSVNVARS